jgi:O-antigen ligase
MAAFGSTALPATTSRRMILQLVITVLAVVAAMILATNQNFLPIALFVSLVLVTVLRFNWFLYATIFFLPWYPFIDWPLPVRDIFLLAHLALFAGMMVVEYRQGVPWRDWLWQGRLRKGLLIFAAVAAASLLLSDSPDAEEAAKALAKLLSYTAVFLTVAGWATTKERVRTIVRLLLVSTIGVCLFGFCQAAAEEFTSFYFRLYPDMEAVFTAQGGWSGRITSFLFHYNSLAGYLNAIVALALAVAVLGKQRLWQWTGFVCLALCFAALFLTSSRGGLVAGAAEVAILLALLAPRRRTTLVVLGALVLAAAIVMSLPATAGGEIRSDRLQSVDEFTLQSREALWGAAALIFLDHPVLGAGFGEFRFAFQQYVPGIEDRLDAHNLYLQTLAETGVVGFLVFFLSMVLFLHSAYKLTKSADPLLRLVGLGVLGAIAATLVHGMVDYIFIASPQFGNLFWVVLGLCVAAEQASKSQQLSVGSKEAG